MKLALLTLLTLFACTVATAKCLDKRIKGTKEESTSCLYELFPIGTSFEEISETLQKKLKIKHEDLKFSEIPKTEIEDINGRKVYVTYDTTSVIVCEWRSLKSMGTLNTTTASFDFDENKQLVRITTQTRRGW